MRKKILSLLLAIIPLACLFAFSACGEKEVKPVVIVAPSNAEGTTLLDYMTKLEGDGVLTFTVSNGMITSIDGTANTTNSFWMLYTSDKANSDTTWGTYDYQGQILGSATLGAGSLVIKQDCIYVWSYEKF